MPDSTARRSPALPRLTGRYGAAAALFADHLTPRAQRHGSIRDAKMGPMESSGTGGVRRLFVVADCCCCSCSCCSAAAAAAATMAAEGAESRPAGEEGPATRRSAPRRLSPSSNRRARRTAAPHGVPTTRCTAAAAGEGLTGGGEGGEEGEEGACCGPCVVGCGTIPTLPLRPLRFLCPRAAVVRSFSFSSSPLAAATARAYCTAVMPPPTTTTVSPLFAAQPLRCHRHLRHHHCVVAVVVVVVVRLAENVPHESIRATPR